jgi:hypothetical protein
MYVLTFMLSVNDNNVCAFLVCYNWHDTVNHFRLCNTLSCANRSILICRNGKAINVLNSRSNFSAVIGWFLVLVDIYSYILFYVSLCKVHFVISSRVVVVLACPPGTSSTGIAFCFNPSRHGPFFPCHLTASGHMRLSREMAYPSSPPPPPQLSHGPRHSLF